MCSSLHADASDCPVVASASVVLAIQAPPDLPTATTIQRPLSDEPRLQEMMEQKCAYVKVRRRIQWQDLLKKRRGK